MKLIVGGYSQGKLAFVLERYAEGNDKIWDGVLPDEKQIREQKAEEKTIIINHFHCWVRERILQKENPEKEIADFIKENKDTIIISDEIGNGIVPIDAFEREYRERTGRILIQLASEADEVVRVICGIGQRIK